MENKPVKLWAVYDNEDDVIQARRHKILAEQDVEKHLKHLPSLAPFKVIPGTFYPEGAEPRIVARWEKREGYYGLFINKKNKMAEVWHSPDGWAVNCIVSHHPGRFMETKAAAQDTIEKQFLAWLQSSFGFSPDQVTFEGRPE